MNTSGGDWSVAGNWSNGVPTTSSDTCIVLPGTYTVTVEGTQTVAELTVGGLIAGGSGTQTLEIGSTCSQDATVFSTSGDEHPRGIKGVQINTHGAIALTNADTCGNNATLQSTEGVTNLGTIHAVTAHGGLRTITASVTNQKLVEIDAGTNLNVNGNYYTVHVNATFQPSIASPSSLGTMTVTGAAYLQDAIQLVNPFHSTTLGQSFTLITASSLVGGFGQNSGLILDKKTDHYYLPTQSSTQFSLVTTQSTLSLSSSSGAPGTPVTVSGTGWEPSSQQLITFNDHNHQNTQKIVPTDASGDFSTVFTIPSGAATGTGGFVARNAVNLKLRQPFTVN
jgi:hypothetical protein